MIIGELLMQSGDPVYYSQWFPRQGDQAIFTVELLAVASEAMGFVMTVETKNSDETDGDAVEAGNSGVLSGLGVSSTSVLGGLKEWVRYMYTFSDVFGGTNEWLQFIMLDPIWMRDA